MTKLEMLEEAATSSLKRLRNLAERYIRNREDAEDVVQEALLSAYTHIEQFRGESKFSTWIGRIVINQALMKIRRHQKDTVCSVQIEDIIPLAVSSDANPEQSYISEEIKENLKNSISYLPPIYKQVVEVYVYEDIPQRKIATKLRIPCGTVKARLSRAKRMLRDMS